MELHLHLSFEGWNGLFQIIGEVLQPVRNNIIKKLNLNREPIGHKIVCIIVTFILVDFSWIFFRAGGTRKALHIIRSMLTIRNPWILVDGSLYNCGLNQKNFQLMLLSIGILLFADIAKAKKVRIRNIIAEQDGWCQIFVIVMSIVLIVLFGIWGGSYNANNFIYFQF